MGSNSSPEFFAFYLLLSVFGCKKKRNYVTGWSKTKRQEENPWHGAEAAREEHNQTHQSLREAGQGHEVPPPTNKETGNIRVHKYAL